MNQDIPPLPSLNEDRPVSAWREWIDKHGILAVPLTLPAFASTIFLMDYANLSLVLLTSLSLAVCSFIFAMIVLSIGRRHRRAAGVAIVLSLVAAWFAVARGQRIWHEKHLPLIDLHSIYYAIESYREGNNGTYPPDLGSLVQGGYIDEDYLGPRPTYNAGATWFYVSPLDEDPNETILICEPDIHSEHSRALLFKDGNIERVSEEELGRLIELPHNSRFAAKLAESAATGE